MNKYEELVFSNSKNAGYYISVVGSNKNYTAKIDTEKKKLVLQQEEDINLTKYQFVALSNPNGSGIEKVSFYKGDKWIEAELVIEKNKKVLALPDYYQRSFERGYVAYVINLDFDDKVKKIRFEYKNGIVEPIDLSIEYVEANKEAYYQKVAAQNRSELLAKMSVSCKTGDFLVNVYWQNATDKVKKILFELFIDNQQLIMKNEMDADVMFKSVQGLAYGKYYFRLSQLDEKGNVIVATDLIQFTLSASNYSGKHTVVI